LKRWCIAAGLFVLPGGIVLAALYLAASRRGRNATVSSQPKE